MELSHHEIEERLDLKYIVATSIGFTLHPGIYEISDFNLIVNSLHPDDLKRMFQLMILDYNQI